MISDVQPREPVPFAGSLSSTVVLPALVVAAVALLLHLFNLVPGVLHPDTVRTYATVEEAARALGAPVSLPVYFPDYLAWPPSRIAVRHKPVTSVSLYFSPNGAGANTLIIHEIFSGDPRAISALVPLPKIVIGQVDTPVGRYQGTLIIGEAERDNPQNQVKWQSGSRYIIMEGPEEPQELLRIASSMKP